MQLSAYTYDILMFSLLILLTGVTCAKLQWDYFMFVQLWPLSWLLADRISDYPFNNNHFTIHGLWPEYKNGSWP